ncbi:tetratricopeptide repeat protein [Halobacillus salinus]|uniref:tetratricopeptide repeat protein n=1 Tax=Halobacillus salinus TaxID=192814 RepID=UPI0009A7C9EE|nr:tetratricopeptide repeat protein [Halobacillus salinus]
MIEINDVEELKRAGKYHKLIEKLKKALSHQTEREKGDLYHHLAQCHDALGYEEEAVRYYRQALDCGVREELKKDTYVCLASSYHVLGLHERALDTANKGLREFPTYSPLSIFKSLILFSNKKEGDALKTVLQDLLRTTSDPDVKKYERALLYYSNQLT